MVIDCTCRRCRYYWQELWGTRHTEGIGSLHWCPRCGCNKIDREAEPVMATPKQATNEARRAD